MSNKDKRKNAEKKCFVFGWKDKKVDEDWEEVENFLLPPISEKEVIAFVETKGISKLKVGSDYEC